MKSKLSSIIPVIILFLFSFLINAQHKKENLDAKYVTVTTLHGVEGADFDEWLKVEKEYFDKVTSKIDMMLDHEVLVRYFSNDLSEIKVINVFRTWSDIEYVNEIREELVQKAWPNEADRKAFFQKQNSFYTNYHSDEIYVTTNLSKLMPALEKASIKNPMVYYFDTNILSDRDNKDAYKLYEEYLNAVVYKNSYIKAYYPFRHYWGADSREFLEIYVVNSLSNLEKALEMDQTLFELFIPNKAKRKEFLKAYRSAVSAHKDGLYKNVPALSK
ncbi:MAG: hypothetical protein J7K34_01445 [Flavobacteriaceae bacterium]|nr:hypothetical protein [Flavobacteriaceae bacterium]